MRSAELPPEPPTPRSVSRTVRACLALLLLAVPALADDFGELVRTAICAGGRLDVRWDPSIGRRKDPRDAPVLYSLSHKYYVAYPAGSAEAQVRAAIEAACRSIGMRPRDAGFLVERWLTPATCPHRRTVAELNKRRPLTKAEVMRRLPPWRLPVVSGNRFTWYPLDEDWTLLIDGDKPPVLSLSPRLPYATERKSLFPKAPPPKPSALAEKAAAGLMDPNYRPDPRHVPMAWSGARPPEREAAWDLKTCGPAMIEPILRRIGELDGEGRYGALFALTYAGRGLRSAFVVTPTGYSGRSFSLDDWVAWYRLRTAHPDARGVVIDLQRVSERKAGEWGLTFRLIVTSSRLRSGVPVRSLLAQWADTEAELPLRHPIRLNTGASLRGTLVLKAPKRPMGIRLVLRVPSPPVQLVRNGTGWTGEVVSNRR